MPSSINASTTAGLVNTADTSGVLQLQTAGVTAISIDASQAVSFTNAPTVTGGTANGVAYLNGSKVLTTGSALVFDGTNLGVGVTPTVRLDIGGVARTQNTANADGVTIKRTNNANANGALNFTGSDDVVDAAIAMATDNADELTFKTAGSERMRITSSGYVGIGTSSPSSYGALAVRKGVNGTWIGVSGNSSFQTSDATNSSLYVVHSSANSGTTFIGTDAAGRLQMFCSASATGGVYLGNGATSWAVASDERVKENLVPIENGLAKVASLRTVTGNYINDESKKSRAFLIAQDVQAVLPEAVDHSNPDELGLSYTDVIPLLVASIQEMKALIDTQASTITQLQADVAALKGA